MVTGQNLVSSCADPALANVLAIIQRMISLLQLVVPILAIISGVIIFFKLMSNPDEKKYRTLIKNAVTAVVIVFLLPAIMNVVMGLFSNTFDFASCWTYVNQSKTTGQNSNYNNTVNKQNNSQNKNSQSSNPLKDDGYECYENGKVIKNCR